ncbi:MAG: aldehyde dehydrogenase family protein [Bryobacteraceae bacterium]|nr:aldehyde dehydrogenase family protein [Bryobacteraceae bacterium]MDW8378157.1 aldehyde dehydrogenase family protein [Bryobacterales bacterium]
MSSAVDASLRTPNQLWIGGEWRDALSGKTFPVLNPATEEEITQVAEADSADVDLAVAAAQKAFESGPWPKMSVTERARLLWRIGDLLLENADELARLETMNNGKPIFESRQVDLPAAAACFQYYAGWVTKLEGATIPVPGNYFNYTLREPFGVVGAIIPWNFPILMAAWKLAPALATGNTVVLKPAEETPLTALRLAEIFETAGVPAGVVNVVPGFGPTAGAALVRHPAVAKIAFTGSTAVGKEIMRAAADTLKSVSLELGGKSPNIVFADADLDAAVRGAINGIFYGKGEVCAAGSRLFVESSIHDLFLEKLTERAGKLLVGDPMHPKTRVGALVSREQMNKVLGYIESGRGEGARLVCGGEPAPQNGKGFFVKPTIFDGVRNSMRLAQEEIFGPVLATLEFRDVEDAISQANQTVYGLAAAVWTRDVKKAHKAARAIKAGTVWVNTYNILDTASPFGGYKMSGFGRELGKHALDLYTQVKSVWVDLND